MELNIQDTFNQKLPADLRIDNSRRQVFDACFSFVKPRVPSKPQLIHFSKEMAEALGINEEEVKEKYFLDVFSGSKVMPETNPYAMCYGGHQFGHWAGQLGDGRAINLAEIVHHHKRWALQLKGAGETPFSRTADGLAVLRSSIREHLCSEAMHHLGVPTTRSLALCLTGDQVLRDVMYDGHPAYEKGAVVCRVSPSFIRFGNFEIFARRKDKENLRKLADYTIQYFYPTIKETSSKKYLLFFHEVLSNTLKMIVEWQRVGFVHGVMNTDNMSILGLTIDYGPYGWLEGYDKGWTPNTTDRQNKRYKYGNQPYVALWNLFQLANALFPLVEEAKPFEEALEKYKIDYANAELSMLLSKLGIRESKKEDLELVESMEKVLELCETDMTIFFRRLANLKKNDSDEDALQLLKPAFYNPEELVGDVQSAWQAFLKKYLNRLCVENHSDQERKITMNKVNPKYVLRNYMAQLAIDAADKGDYNLIDELHQVLKAPYDEQVDSEKWFAKRPEWARHKVGCSMLSCSS